MEIRQLKIFMIVCDEMSFTKAAKKLSYAQSTISDNIQALEKSIGYSLFERLGKRIYLTEKGKLSKDLGKKLIIEYDYVLNTITENEKETIRIGITESLCSYKFPDFFRNFLLKNTNIQIHFEIKRDKDIIEMLRKSTIYIGFTLDEKIDNPNFITYKLFDEEIVFISSKQLSNLNDESIVIPAGYVAYLKYFHDYYNQEHIKKGSVVHMESIEGIKSYVKNGFGISFLPLTTVQKEINEESLFLVKQDKRFFHEIKILVHKDKNISKGLNSLIENTIKTYKKTKGQRLIFKS